MIQELQFMINENKKLITDMSSSKSQFLIKDNCKDLNDFERVEQLILQNVNYFL